MNPFEEIKAHNQTRINHIEASIIEADLEKGRALPEGTHSIHGGKKVVKQGGKWIPHDPNEHGEFNSKKKSSAKPKKKLVVGESYTVPFGGANFTAKYQGVKRYRGGVSFHLFTLPSGKQLRFLNNPKETEKLLGDFKSDEKQKEITQKREKLRGHQYSLKKLKENYTNDKIYSNSALKRRKQFLEQQISKLKRELGDDAGYKKNDIYVIESGMGGTFPVKYLGKKDGKHQFQNKSKGWTHQVYSYTDDEAAEKVFQPNQPVNTIQKQREEDALIFLPKHKGKHIEEFMESDFFNSLPLKDKEYIAAAESVQNHIDKAIMNIKDLGLKDWKEKTGTKGRLREIILKYAEEKGFGSSFVQESKHSEDHSQVQEKPKPQHKVNASVQEKANKYFGGNLGLSYEFALNEAFDTELIQTLLGAGADLYINKQKATAWYDHVKSSLDPNASKALSKLKTIADRMGVFEEDKPKKVKVLKPKKGVTSYTPEMGDKAPEGSDMRMSYSHNARHVYLYPLKGQDIKKLAAKIKKQGGRGTRVEIDGNSIRVSSKTFGKIRNKYSFEDRAYLD